MSEKTNDATYKQKVERIYDKLGPARLNGMWPTLANRNTGRPSSNVYTMGALSDSFYEYLLKMWLQGGKKETRWRNMYVVSVYGTIDLCLDYAVDQHNQTGTMKPWRE